MKENRISAISEKEVKDFLASIGELEVVESGCATCAFCGAKITISNLHAIIPGLESITYCCDSSQCIAEMSWGEKNNG